MWFLAPALLAALAALAVPVVLHLTERERKQVVVFPSLQFLRRVPYRSVRRRRIRHWPLLVLRALALACLVAAFARPFFTSPALATAGAGSREVVVLLDRSFSMDAGTTWTQALDAVRAALRGLTSGDRVSLVTFSDEVEVIVRSAADAPSVVAAVDGLTVDSGATRPSAALKLASGILAESSLARRSLVVVSDFQKAGWAGLDRLSLPEGTDVTPVPVGDPSTGNVAVTSATAVRSRFEGQERVTVTANLVSHDATARTEAVTLEVDGRPRGTVTVSLAPESGATATFEPFTLDSNDTRLRIGIPADGLSSDNHFHATLAASRPIPVVVVSSSGADVAYVSRALGIGQAPAFAVTERSGDDLAALDPGKFAVAIVDDVPLTASVLDRVRAFATAGGGVWIVLGDRSAAPAGTADVLPAQVGAVVDRGARGVTLGDLANDHAVFDVFRTPGSGDFRGARYYRTRALTSPTGTVLARFDDGAPALVEKAVGRGRVLVWASTLERGWNDLALRPVFLPFVHRTTAYLARYSPPHAWLTVGQALDVSAELQARRVDAASASVRIVDPSGRPAVAEETDRPVVAVREPGFYEIRIGRDGGTAAFGVAVNVDPGESDLTRMDPKEALAAAATTTDATTSGAVAAGTPDVQERQQRLWTYLLAAAVALLVGETIAAAHLRETS